MLGHFAERDEWLVWVVAAAELSAAGVLGIVGLRENRSFVRA